MTEALNQDVLIRMEPDSRVFDSYGSQWERTESRRWSPADGRPLRMTSDMLIRSYGPITAAPPENGMPSSTVVCAMPPDPNYWIHRGDVRAALQRCYDNDDSVVASMIASWLHIELDEH